MEQETTSGEGGGMDLSALLGSLQGGKGGSGPDLGSLLDSLQGGKEGGGPDLGSLLGMLGAGGQEQKGQESAGARQRDAEKEAAENACESGAQQGAAGQGRDRLFNAATGSYSGTYGQGEVSEVTRGQIDQILREKKDVIRELVESAGNI